MGGEGGEYDVLTREGQSAGGVVLDSYRTSLVWQRWLVGIVKRQTMTDDGGSLQLFVRIVQREAFQCQQWPHNNIIIIIAVCPPPCVRVRTWYFTTNSEYGLDREYGTYDTIRYLYYSLGRE